MAIGSNFGSMFGGMYSNTFLASLNPFSEARSSALSEAETFLLADTKFKADYNKNIVGRSTSRKRFSETSSLKRVSASDYKALLDIDLFRTTSNNVIDDIANTKMSTGKYRKDWETGEIRRTGGVELSALDEAGIEQLAQVVAGRQSQIQGRALSTGLGQQSFSLLSGNFG